jgi:hypothetical protein
MAKTKKRKATLEFWGDFMKSKYATVSAFKKSSNKYRNKRI